MKTVKIYDGVGLTVIPSEKFKTNFMSVNFVLPIEADNVHLTALVPKILARGCRKYPDMAKISEKLEYLYASGIAPVYVKRAESLIVGFSADFIKDAYVPDGTDLVSEVCALLFGMLFEPLCENGAFREDYTESEKIDLVNFINSKINNKAAYAKDRCTAEMFKGYAYGISEYGKVEDVKTATAKDAYGRYLEIVNKYPIEIFYNGECDEEKLVEILKKHIPDTARPEKYPGKRVLSGTPEKVNEVNETMPVAQGKLVMGLRIGGIDANSPEAAAFSVFNEIFGGSPSSKLFMNVREAMSLCYYCRSMPDMYMSTMFISSGIETANKDKAKNAILEQLEKVQNGEFTAEEIEDAKRSIRNAYREIDDSASAECLWHLSRRINGSAETPETVVGKIMAVTKDEIIKVSEKVVLDTVYFLEGTGNEAEEEDEE